MPLEKRDKEEEIDYELEEMDYLKQQVEYIGEEIEKRFRKILSEFFEKRS
ncbi:MAG: hypothetical protein KAU62_04735 [Candidatus Heimdallarchaeota archaeon]|nr:hypothetical protein [Candidatus Heimdallarchaeota archaeon]MCK4610444.1 hypothetical protein [Candidatus Heimdallarchaeota archaeon]